MIRTSVIAVLLLGMNLLIPQQVLRYRACCLDSSGQLRPAASCCQPKPQMGVTGRPSCCVPEIVRLREAPAAPTVTPSRIDNSTPDYAGLAAVLLPTVLVAETETAQPLLAAWFDTGPPSASLLASQCRLNL